MKIARVEAPALRRRLATLTFVRIETDSGPRRLGECSDNRSPHGIAGCVR